MSLFVLFFFCFWQLKREGDPIVPICLNCGIYSPSFASFRSRCHHIPAGTPLEDRKCQIIAPWASSKPMTFIQVHKCQLWDGNAVCHRPYLPRVRPLPLTNELAWCLLPRWLAGCLAQRAVPQMVREREQEGANGRSFLLCHRRQPPPPPVITRTTKQPPSFCCFGFWISIPFINPIWRHLHFPIFCMWHPSL